MGWLVPREELTADQLRAVELNLDRHRLIMGAPGSGKTLVLMHRARYLLDRYRWAPDRFHIFVFTNVLHQYIRSALEDLALPEQCVSTFDDWCVQYHERFISRRLPWNAAARQPDYGAIRAAVRRHAAGRRLFEAVMVDEGQDLPPEDVAFLAQIAGHVTVAMDRRQQIYEEGSEEAEILRALGLRRSDVALLDAFRCSEYIVRIASEFLPDPRERDAFLHQARGMSRDRETPLLYLASDFRDEKTRLLEALRERQLADRSVALLFPLNRQVGGFAEWLRTEGFEVETRKSGLDFDSARPKLLTIHSAKGLTFDSVLLPRLVLGSFPGGLQARRERLLYVAITRATRWVYLSAVESDQIPELERLRKLAGEACAPLTVAGGSAGSHGARTGSPAQVHPVEDELSIL